MVLAKASAMFDPGFWAALAKEEWTAIAAAPLGGLYLLLRREPMPDKKTPKKIIVSNVR